MSIQIELEKIRREGYEEGFRAGLTKALALCETSRLDVFDEQDNLWNGAVDDCRGKILDYSSPIRKCRTSDGEGGVTSGSHVWGKDGACCACGEKPL